MQLKIVIMKISAVILFFFVIGASRVVAQKPRQIINDKDSTLGMYLNSRIEKSLNHFTDTCFEGFYEVAFSLKKNGDIKEFTTSKKMPQKYSDTIQALLNLLKPYWTKDFVNFVSKNNSVIVQPLYLSVMENCNSKNAIAYQPAGDTTALAAMTERSEFWEFAVKEKIRLITTFPTISDFKNENIDLRNTYLLPPATIMRGHPKNRRKID